jgi:ATP-dependent Clp protease, protease subunit
LNTIITETTEHGEVPIDIYQKLSNDRILFLTDFIDDKVATDISATLLLKDTESTDNKITLFINSEGGDIRAVFMIYDTMQMISSPIEVVCFGSAMNEAALILVGGSKGMRYATKNSIIAAGQLISQWAKRSNMVDAAKTLAQVTKDNKRMMEILAKHSGKKLAQVTKDLDRIVFLEPVKAAKYGFIDGIIKFGKK